MKLSDTIAIAAPASRVWNVTTDVEAWPQWAPTFTSVQREDRGPFELGSSALIKQPGLPEARWVVTSLTPGECFTWETRIRGLHLIATHQITPHAVGTANAMQVELRGLVGCLLAPLLAWPVKRSLARENAALKAHCEQGVNR